MLLLRVAARDFEPGTEPGNKALQAIDEDLGDFTSRLPNEWRSHLEQTGHSSE